MKKLILAIAMIVFSTVALADKTIILPDGTVCFINRSGVVYGCHGGPDG